MNFKKSDNDIIFSNNNIKKIEKEYNKRLKTSRFSKNIIPIQKDRFAFIEKIIKFFIKIIMFIALPKTARKNKIKTKELIDRVYTRFMSRDFAFIPASFAFYLLASFIPIVTSVYLLLRIMPLDIADLFLSEILGRIIPGVSTFVDSLKIESTAQILTIGALYLATLWVSSGGFAKFIYSENYIYKHENTGNWFINRIKGFLTVFGITVYIFITIAVYLYIYKATGLVEADSYKKYLYFYITFSFFLLITLYIGFSLLFKITPAFKLPFYLVLPGSLITTIPTTFFITLFGYIFSAGIINYNQYGIFGTIMYIALLISFVSYFMYLGIIANESYYKTYYSTYTVKKKVWSFKIIKF
ncbi:Ribonuclease BN-like family [Mycoplasmopsis maculosa]|uniref:Ribonuclease BN-like family n=1 Tax=Mycoplasmopsis maculosa TaxID=114885 RepID=A0A449B503_9BACT|nr:YhjD/YihY/BrkB family envelope integrity protein [Mycoplasmopsis maculosa]VEU75683.1 Ribonuclease BN-like family [Mycoplasmopsis maculosa]